jgi:hypothetical protein
LHCTGPRDDIVFYNSRVRSAARLFAALALALFFAGAAASAPVSGLRGVVMEGPIKPVCRVDEPCERPVRGLVLEFKRAGRVVARVKTSLKGTYSIRLRAGTYSVTTVPQRRVGTGLTPKSVRVPKGRMAKRDFHLDTGLR